ncbi:MAG: hypothetical protein ACJ8FO_00615 [Sphingomicrobium sp.]
MLPEALALLVALALQRLAVDAVDSKQACDPAVHVDDQRIVSVEIAAVAGADVFPLLLVVERRGVAAPVDLLAHLPARFGIKELIADVELNGLSRARAQPPQPRRRLEIVADPPADDGAKIRPLLSKRDRRLVIRRRFGVGHRANVLEIGGLANQRAIWRTIDFNVRASSMAWPWMSLLK